MLGVVDVPYGVTPEILMTDDFFLVGDTNRLQKFTYDNVEQAALDFEVWTVCGRGAWQWVVCTPTKAGGVAQDREW